MTDFALIAQLNGSAESFQVVVFYQAEIVELQDLLLVDRRRIFDFWVTMVRWRHCSGSRPVGPLARAHVDKWMLIGSESDIGNSRQGQGRARSVWCADIYGIQDEVRNGRVFWFLSKVPVIAGVRHSTKGRKTMAITYHSKQNLPRFVKQVRLLCSGPLERE